MISIDIDTKNPTEVLGCYGILALDFLLDKQISRSRFVEGLELISGKDGRLRSGVFEFEHPDFAGFLKTCCEMKLLINGNEEINVLVDRPVLTLDWYNGSLFLGDLGNFSKADKLQFVKTHQQALATTVDSVQNHMDLFSTAIEMRVPNYLSSYNCYKKGYQDAGGMYEVEDVFYASEWFLLIALQVFRHHWEKYLRSRYFLRYCTFSDYLATHAAFGALVGGHHSCRVYKSEKRKFGKGAVLRAAQEMFAN